VPVYAKRFVVCDHLLEAVWGADPKRDARVLPPEERCHSDLKRTSEASIYSKTCAFCVHSLFIYAHLFERVWGADPKRDARVLPPEERRHSHRDAWRRSSHLGRGFKASGFRASGFRACVNKRLIFPINSLILPINGSLTITGLFGCGKCCPPNNVAIPTATPGDAPHTWDQGLGSRISG